MQNLAKIVHLENLTIFSGVESVVWFCNYENKQLNNRQKHLDLKVIVFESTLIT